MADIHPPATDTPVGKLRRMIPDAELRPNTIDWSADPAYMFSDADLEVYLELARGSVIRASAFALEALGASEAIISKVITTEDLATNGAAMLNAFTQTARYRHAAADKAEEADAAEESFNIVPFQPWPLHFEPR